MHDILIFMAVLLVLLEAFGVRARISPGWLGLAVWVIAHSFADALPAW